MRKPILLIFTNALLLIGLFVLLAQSLFLVKRLAQASEVRGQVEVARKDGHFSPLKIGETVAVGDVVQTGTDGLAEFVWADKTRWRVMPNSRLTIQKASVSTREKAENSQFRLDAGKVFLRMVKPLAPKSSFEVETPSATASARGTVFSVEVAGMQTKVCVYEGLVNVSGSDLTQVKSISPGQQAIADDAKIAVVPTDNAAFQTQPTLLKPTLEVGLQNMGSKIWIIGAAEAGDRVSINGKNTLILGNGTFRSLKTPVEGYNEWKIAATDKHGAQSDACRAADYKSQSQIATPRACR